MGKHVFQESVGFRISYYEKAGFGPKIRNFSLKRTTIRLKIAYKMTQTGLPLATTAMEGGSVGNAGRLQGCKRLKLYGT